MKRFGSVLLILATLFGVLYHVTPEAEAVSWEADNGDICSIEGEFSSCAHRYQSKDYEATCLDYKKTVYTCTICGDTYTVYDGMTDWSTTKPSGVPSNLIESRTEYRYRNKEYTTSKSSSLSGWTLYAYGNQWTDYGPWSEWSMSSVTSDDYTQVETRTAYAYYYYKCPNCGAHMHGWNLTCPTWAGGCGKGFIGRDHYVKIWSTIPYSQAGLKDFHGTGKYYTTINGERVFRHDDSPQTQYRYRTRTLETIYYFYRWGNWSGWSPTAVTATSDREVQKRTVYRYLDAKLGDHKYSSSTDETCNVCGKTRVITLAAPSVKASNVASSGKIKLTWNKISGASKYEVYRATSKNGTYSKLSTVTGTSLTNNSTTAGKTYYYKVRAVAADGRKSKFSSIVSRTCDLPRPDVSVSNVVSTGKIKLSWKKIDGAVKYEVYRATSKNGTYKLLKTVTGTSLTNTSTTAGKTYYYKVRAIHSNSSANSAYSGIVSRTCDLAQPVVKATNVASTGKIKLTWNKVEGAAKYEVYRATSKNGSYKLLKTVTGTSLTNTSTTAGKTYYYRVRAIHSKSAANSAYSTVDSRTCDLARPTLSVSVGNKGKVMLSWTSVKGAVKYRVYRSTSENGTYELIKSTNLTGYVDSNTYRGKTYYYKVIAIHDNSAANSAYSSIKAIRVN